MKLRLLEKRPETSDCITFVWENPKNTRWIAGQFQEYKIENEAADDRKENRWFTISSAPFEKHFQITTRFNREHPSTFKKDLHDLAVGDEIEVVSGPDGDFTLEEPGDIKYCFIAGGVGITPFRSILLQLDNDKKRFKIQLLYANKSQEVIFKDELEELAKRNSGLKIEYVFDPERIDEHYIKNHVNDFDRTTFYVSGPEPMVEGLEKMLKELDIPEEQIKGDFFPGYTTH